MTPTFMSTPVIEHVNVDTGSRPWRRVKATFNPRRWGDESSAFFICKILGGKGCVCVMDLRDGSVDAIFPLCLALSKFRKSHSDHKPSIQWLLYPYTQWYSMHFAWLLDVFGTCSNMLKGFVQILVSTLLAWDLTNNSSVCVAGAPAGCWIGCWSTAFQKNSTVCLGWKTQGYHLETILASPSCHVCFLEAWLKTPHQTNHTVSEWCGKL